MVEKDIRGGICDFVYSHEKANNKYMNDYDKKIVTSAILGCKQFIWQNSKIPLNLTKI